MNVGSSLLGRSVMDKQLWPCGFWDFGTGLIFFS